MNLPAIVPGVGTENEVEAESVETVATTSNNANSHNIQSLKRARPNSILLSKSSSLNSQNYLKMMILWILIYIQFNITFLNIMISELK